MLQDQRNGAPARISSSQKPSRKPGPEAMLSWITSNALTPYSRPSETISSTTTPGLFERWRPQSLVAAQKEHAFGQPRPDSTGRNGCLPEGEKSERSSATG